MTMGLPRLLTTDQGKEFKNELNKEMMNSLGIKHHLITPYHPQVGFCTLNYMYILYLLLVFHVFLKRPMD